MTSDDNVEIKKLGDENKRLREDVEIPSAATVVRGVLAIRRVSFVADARV